jgi:hypothetical protein
MGEPLLAGGDPAADFVARRVPVRGRARRRPYGGDGGRCVRHRVHRTVAEHATDSGHALP